MEAQCRVCEFMLTDLFYLVPICDPGKNAFGTQDCHVHKLKSACTYFVLYARS